MSPKTNKTPVWLLIICRCAFTSKEKYYFNWQCLVWLSNKTLNLYWIINECRYVRDKIFAAHTGNDKWMLYLHSRSCSLKRSILHSIPNLIRVYSVFEPWVHSARLLQELPSIAILKWSTHTLAVTAKCISCAEWKQDKGRYKQSVRSWTEQKVNLWTFWGLL